MPLARFHVYFGLLSALTLVVASVSLAAAVPTTVPPEGPRQNTPTVHALVDATLVIEPGNTVEHGTLVIRDGVIVAAGRDVAVPPDARTWPMAGKTIYAGFCDAYTEAGAGSPAAPSYWNPLVQPEYRVADGYQPDAALNRTLRGQGCVLRLVAPSSGIVRGVSAVVTTGDAAASGSVVVPEAALHLRLTPSGAGRRDGYPTSPMGAYTLVRQAFYDARWYQNAWNLFGTRAGLTRPEQSHALESLGNYLGHQRKVMIDAPDEFYALRAAAIAAEFELNAVIRGSGREYRRMDALAATGRTFVLPVDFALAPDVRSPEGARNVNLARLLDWDLAPENPARAQAAGVRFAFTSHGLKDKSKFLAGVRRAVARGLAPDDALRALTIAPAELLGVSERAGSLSPGKAAHLVVADGAWHLDATRFVEVWVDGKRYEIVTPPRNDARGTWQLRVQPPAGDARTLELVIAGKPEKLSARLKPEGDKPAADLEHITLEGEQLRGVFDGEKLGIAGRHRLSLTLAPQADGTLNAQGLIAWADGSQTSATASRIKLHLPPAEAAAEKPAAAADKPSDKPADKPAEQIAEKPADAAATTAADKPESKAEEKPKDEKPASDSSKLAKPPEPVRALFAANFPLGGLGIAAAPEQPKAVVFRHATIWTCGPQGVLEDASLLVEGGRVTAIGRELVAPAGAVEVDATGRHISPGIIDCHSHIATDGGVNESGQAVTAEVRIGDFIDADDENIYRQVAGGVTSSNILHGSANPIGGQNQVIKLRWGALPEQMKFAGAPQGIKFALGENVKQSNWGDRFTTRYPQSRMGVDELIRDEFRAARDYRRRWEEWNRQQTGMPPRVDLELEAISEVLAGKRLVHCHSYRQDEILALLLTCREFGVKIATLQHILEGYKLADVIARDGIGGSSFSDWWAYKFEVIDAIPYNGAIMHRAGVVVSFNSDDAELARRLNLEAAKAVKYGGVPAAEALAFVTINPARQLGIADRVGSLEVGKDADLVLWSASPLSSCSRCEQTWIDGRRYFDRTEDAARREAAAKMRAALIQRVLTSGEAVAGPDDAKSAEKDLWPRVDLFCGHDHDHAHGE